MRTGLPQGTPGQWPGWMAARWRRAVAACAVAALAGLCAGQDAIAADSAGLAAEDVGRRPEAARRIVRVFDFEEKQTNPSPVPAYFIRAQDDASVPRERPGFPMWNRAELDYAMAYRGEGALRLPTEGGSASLLLEPGVVPVFENADYMVTAWVRTEGLSQAGAVLAARFTDRAGQPIWASTARSRVVRTAGEWTQVEIELPGEYPGAAFIQLELLLLQPEQATAPADPTVVLEEREAARRARAVWRQDFTGAAWFDDVAVVQLPRLELATGEPGGISVGGDPPSLRLSVRDLTAETLSARLTVRDVEGRVVDRTDVPLGGGSVQTSWRPGIEKFGWYRATLEVMNDTTRVGASSVDFAWLAPRSTSDEEAEGAGPVRRAEADRFGLIINSIEPALASVVGEVIRRTGAGAATVPVWSRELSKDDLDAALRVAGPAIDATVQSWGELTLSLPRVPDELGEPMRLDADDPWGLLATDAAGWSGYLDHFLDRYGQLVRRWQIGQAGDDTLFWRADPRADVQRAERALGKLVPGPVVAAPWRIDRGLSKAVAASVRGREDALALIASVPVDARAEDIRAFAAHAGAVFGTSSRPEMTLALSPDRGPETGYAESSARLARQVVESWAAFGVAESPTAVRVRLVQPWDTAGVRRPRLMPRPELAAWHTLQRHLTGRRVAGRFPSPPGTVCYVLVPSRGEPTRGSLVAWNESAPHADAVLRAGLGTGEIEVTDLYGNKAPAPVVRGGAAGLREIALGDAPVFIDNVDINLVRFVAGFAVEPPFIVSTSQPQQNALVVQNPWPVILEGRATIVQPGGFDSAAGVRDRRWTISPRSFQFAIPPGQSQSLIFDLSFTPSEEAGPRDFVMRFELAADKNYPPFELTVPVELGLRHVSLEVTASPGIRAGAPTDDLVVEARVVNTGSQPLTAELASFVPGEARQRASVAELAPGAEALRRFVYPGAISTHRGKRVVVSLSELETGNRLNKAAVVE